ncbi:hypothetical protein ATCR1_23523 [Agrobacterium tumefaciens CCNWGS0286]|nr:hypothetical protein ATCR1_23523 [Agrobacterium tumefaciens CCNWGS0286]
MQIKDVIDIVDATSATLSGSSFDNVNLSGTVFNNVNLAGTRFNDINFSGASFTDSNMSGWSIDDVNFTGLKLSNTNLSGAQITACRMTGRRSTAFRSRISWLPTRRHRSRPDIHSTSLNSSIRLRWRNEWLSSETMMRRVEPSGPFTTSMPSILSIW